MQEYLRKCLPLQGFHTQANDQFPLTPGSGGAGSNVATMRVTSGANTVDYQVVMIADESGHVQDSLPTYFYQSPDIAVGASKLWIDIFNATGSGKVMDIRGIWINPNSSVAVTGTVGVRLDIYRTSAVGTGGTASSTESATFNVGGGNFWRADLNDTALPAQITARVVPTGGATISQWLFPMQFFPEESNAAITLTPGINWVPMFHFAKRIVVRENTGLLIKQSPIASVGSASILIAFTLQ